MASLYFAYGSNLSVPQMRERCGAAHPLGPAVLHDHRVAFTYYSHRRGGGVADIVPSRGQSVHGLLYEVTDQDLAVLDRHEGGYRRVRLTVHTPGDVTMAAWTYEVVNRQTFVAPTDDYLRLVLDGAAAADAPRDHLDSLRAAAGHLVPDQSP